VIHFTGYEVPFKDIRLDDVRDRRVGHLLGTADMLAQMSDRCYLEKCRDRLYPEFVEGGIAKRVTREGEETVFASAEDLLHKTPGFFATASKRLDHDLGSAYRYATHHFGGENLYMDALTNNIRFAERLRDDPGLTLRRVPPDTIQ
jgi:hypothetical protein